MSRNHRTSGILIVFLLIIGIGSSLTSPIILSDFSENPSRLLIAAQDTVPQIGGFSNNILLSTDDNSYAHHVEVTMAISDNGTIFAGWKNSETHNGGGARVSIVKSVDGGNTWTKPFDMPHFDDQNTRQSDPWLYWHGGTIYYAYLEFEPEYFTNPLGGYLTQMTVAKSNDYGATWNPVRASDGNYFADKETMAIRDDGTIFLVYDDADISEDGNATVRITRSTDGGDTYQETAILGEDMWYLGPYVAFNSLGHVFVAWTWSYPGGGNLCFARSTDDGATFSDKEFINDDANSTGATFSSDDRIAKATLPVITFDQNDRLYVLWDDLYTGTFDVYLRYSDDFGENWSDRIRVNPAIEGDQWNPDMIIDSQSDLLIVYYDEQSDVYRPYYRKISFTGENRDTPVFGDTLVIADQDTPSKFTRPGEYFAIRLDKNSIPHVVWSDGRNDELDIYYARGITTSTTTSTTSSTTNTGLFGIGIEIWAIVITFAVVTVIVLVVYLRRH